MSPISAMEHGKCSPGGTCKSLCGVTIHVIVRQPLVASRRKAMGQIHERLRLLFILAVKSYNIAIS